ncbi:helix-turn-helix domain-containing protein [Tenacibaculum sp. M341]|uniref:helix-turn-helix domain-containing protein n=1 Tax=Tenacibaculum sp. M341 TaxID=2530339 RepID=UPI00104C69A4|nr:helix-turn-helix domain-containing protein [Tenacibaculum sp. M341]TCI93562.1 AraC family transcriptional regulator [Tenacibaculum sp. M341]
MIIHIDSIENSHKLIGIPAPKHPLVSLINLKDISILSKSTNTKFLLNMFMISLKDGAYCSINYGRNSYDFSNGAMVFTKPNQVLSSEDETIDNNAKGWLLFFHPDLIRKSALGKNIHQYSFFDYEIHEALHLSEEEQETVTEIVKKIEKEYLQNIDKHSQKLIISNIELLLDYCNRYYDRQFYVRTNLNQDRVSEFELLLKNYFSSEKPHKLGIPSVKYCGEELNMSPNYLSDLLKKEIGKSAKDHIHDFIVNSAKNQLLGSTNSVSEIAYNLGFDYPQHFSKLSKKKTGITPTKFRTLN